MRERGSKGIHALMLETIEGLTPVTDFCLTKTKTARSLCKHHVLKREIHFSSGRAHPVLALCINYKRSGRALLTVQQPSGHSLTTPRLLPLYLTEENDLIWLSDIFPNNLTLKNTQAVSPCTYLVLTADGDPEDIRQPIKKGPWPFCKMFLKWKLMGSLFWELFYSWMQLDEINLQGEILFILLRLH